MYTNIGRKTSGEEAAGVIYKLRWENNTKFELQKNSAQELGASFIRVIIRLSDGVW